MNHFILILLFKTFNYVWTKDKTLIINFSLNARLCLIQPPSLHSPLNSHCYCFHNFVFSKNSIARELCNTTFGYEFTIYFLFNLHNRYNILFSKICCQLKDIRIWKCKKEKKNQTCGNLAIRLTFFIQLKIVCVCSHGNIYYNFLVWLPKCIRFRYVERNAMHKETDSSSTVMNKFKKEL